MAHIYGLYISIGQSYSWHYSQYQEYGRVQIKVPALKTAYISVECNPKSSQQKTKYVYSLSFIINPFITRKAIQHWHPGLVPWSCWHQGVGGRPMVSLHSMEVNITAPCTGKSHMAVPVDKWSWKMDNWVIPWHTLKWRPWGPRTYGVTAIYILIAALWLFQQKNSIHHIKSVPLSGILLLFVLLLLFSFTKCFSFIVVQQLKSWGLCN